MAKRKPTPPELSKIERERPLAYSRRQKGGEGKDAEASDAPKAAEAKPAEVKAAEAKPVEAKPAEASDAPKAEEAKPSAEAPTPEAASSEPEIQPPPPKGEPWPDATPQPMRPVEAPARARSETIVMPAELVVGSPPPLPAGNVEAPTHMPGPQKVPGGNVTDPALPPGLVPPGDSRSLRKGNEFALIYRQGTAVISRFGTVGQRGQWRVVEYPTPASASNSYAKEVSRFVGDGFLDYRE